MNINTIFGLACIGGGLWLAQDSPFLGIPLVLLGAISVPFLNCSTIAAGNVGAGTTQCHSILSQMIGPL